MQVIRAISEMQAAARRYLRDRKHKHSGLVPTMGALHEGHASLIRAARRECDTVVVSIFVNPLQFGPSEDFEEYPRSQEGDCRIALDAGADIVFIPSGDEMYGPDFQTRVEVEKITRPLEGKQRPGHFRGVTTVVAKLLNIVRPDAAYFGQKDAQQAAAIARMVADLSMSVEIKVLPTVREPDGLALSSRNAYLDRRERREALCLNAALQEAAEAVRDGERRAVAVKRAIRQRITANPSVVVDYVAVVDPETFQPVKEIQNGSLAAVAVRIGGTRLIDNVTFSTDGD